MSQRAVGTTLLWILAIASVFLLIYETATLVGSVLRPLLANPQALQTDFHYYYEAARRFSADDTLLYLPSDDVIAGFAYPPPAIVPFMWLQRLPLGAALLLFTIASYAALLVAVRLWLSHLQGHGVVTDSRSRIAIVLIVLAAGPTYMNAIFGQVNAFILACSVVFVTFAPLAPLAAAFVLALGIWLKVYPVILLAVGAWDRRTWRAIGWTIVAAVVVTVAVLPAIPPAAYRVFFSEVLPARIDKTAIHITNQSLVAFIERFRYSSDLFLNWTGQQAVTVSAVVRAINLVFGGATIAALALRRQSHVANAACLIALVAVIAPLGWGHTYMMVLPLVILQLVEIKHSTPLVAIAIFLCVLALMVPAGRHLPIDRVPDWLENVVYSRYLIATIALMLISSARGRAAGPAPVISSA